MTKFKHVLVLILFILPMFALAPSLVASPNETLTSPTEADISLPAAFVEETLRVAVYAEPNTTLPAYATGGVYTDNYANVISLLTTAGFAVTAMTTQDILDHNLLAAEYDVLVLPNQLPKDEIVNLVKDYWLAGGGILSIDGSIGYCFYAGLIHESFEGGFELVPPASPGYWVTVNSTSFSTVEVSERHPVTKAYDVGTEFSAPDRNFTVVNGIELSPIMGDRLVPLINTTAYPLPLVSEFINPNKGGKLIHVPGDCDSFQTWQRQIIIDAIDYLAPRPKARVAIDFTHVPFYGVDSWDENVTWAPRFEIWRDSIVNHSSTFDKLYPIHGENLTANDLAPFDVLIINMPSINYTAGEITVIRDWVQNGGGLYLIGEYATSFLIEDQRIESIIEGLGITFYTGGEIIPGSSVITEFEEHPILEGVGSFVIPAGSYFNVTAPAYPVAYFGEPNIAMAGRDYGEGRILAIADVNAFDHNWIDDEDNMQLSINVINWLSSGPAKVLVYADGYAVNHPNYVPLNGPVAQALNDLGIPFYLTFDEEYFNMSLFRDDWDMVVYDNGQYNTEDKQSHLIDFVAGGGELIISTYRINETVGAYFGVKMNNTIGTLPPTVYLWEQGHPIFNLPAAYGETTLNSSLDVGYGTYAINFTTYANATPLAGYTAAHAGAAITIGAGGNVIVNGPLITLYNEDTDDSTYADNLEIWENEIAFLYFDRPTIDHPDDVTYMETETGNEITWTGTADAGPWEYVVRENGSIVEAGHWTGGALTFNVDGVNASLTEYELTVFDTLGYSASDLVVLNVTEYIAPTTTTTTTGAPLDPTLLLIIGGAVVGVVIIIIIMMQLKKKK